MFKFRISLAGDVVKCIQAKLLKSYQAEIRSSHQTRLGRESNRIFSSLSSCSAIKSVVAQRSATALRPSLSALRNGESSLYQAILHAVCEICVMAMRIQCQVSGQLRKAQPF